MPKITLTVKEYRELAKAGRVGNIKKGDKAKAYIESALKLFNFDFVREHKFCETRKFRFDFCAIDKRLGIEYEGLMSAKSGHTTIGGYTSNCEKYNIAQLGGWTVLRYTVLNYKNVSGDLRMFLSKPHAI